MWVVFFEVIEMIYITVGTQKFPFDRLLKAVDLLAGSGEIKESIFAQTGYSTYQPKHYEYTDFLKKEEFDAYIARCDLLITHSGVATIIAGLKYKKPVIVMPRLVKYGEHVDDHQVQIADSFSAKNLLFKCGEEDMLGTFIVKAKVHRFDEYVSQRQKTVNVIRKFIKDIQEE